MKHCITAAALILTLFASTPFAVGRSAVIALEFPAGAVNTGMGECGVSLANNVHSIFWNPASIPAILEYQSSQLIVSRFYEPILPSMRIPDLWHAETTLVVALPRISKHITAGLSYRKSHLESGLNNHNDSLPAGLNPYPLGEDVKSYSLGLRFADMVSVGASLKEYTSVLGRNIAQRNYWGSAEGVTFDVGARLEKRISILDLVYITPAAGLSFLNTPADSIEYSRSSSDSSESFLLPKMTWFGASLSIDALGLFGISMVKEREYYIPFKSFSDHSGWRMQITPFYALLRGTMDDPAGYRHETTKGYVLTFNAQTTLNALKRTSALFNPSRALKLAQFDSLCARYHIKPNIYMEYAHNDISAKDNQPRDGQWRKERSFGISVIGDIRGVVPKNIGELRRRCTPPLQISAPRAEILPPLPPLQTPSVDSSELME